MNDAPALSWCLVFKTLLYQIEISRELEWSVREGGGYFFMIWSYGIGSKECVVMWHIDGRRKGVECQKSRRWKQFGLIWAKHLAGSPQTAQSWHLHLQEARKQGIGPHSTSLSNPIPQHKHRYYNHYISIEQISFLFSIDEIIIKKTVFKICYRCPKR